MRTYWFLLFFLFQLLEVYGQRKYSGNVVDAWDKKYLEGIEVLSSRKEKSITNARGYFSIDALMGDTLIFSFPGFLDKKVIVAEETFLFVELQDRARLLPTFQVDAEPFRFRFKDGKLSLVEEEEKSTSTLSQQLGAGVLDSSSPQPGIGIYGPISYFTKRNRQLRAYEKRLEWERRRTGYLEIIDSDSLRTAWMRTYGLDRSKWDELLLKFNAKNAENEFLDWSKEQVLVALEEFLRSELYSDF